MRTALTLDLLGKLDQYKNVFDFNTYRKHIETFIWHIITTRNDNQINNEIYNLLKRKKQINYFRITLSKLKNQRKKLQLG